jgi:hypothetical protein
VSDGLPNKGIGPYQRILLKSFEQIGVSDEGREPYKTLHRPQIQKLTKGNSQGAGRLTQFTPKKGSNLRHARTPLWIARLSNR